MWIILVLDSITQLLELELLVLRPLRAKLAPVPQFLAKSFFFEKIKHDII